MIAITALALFFITSASAVHNLGLFQLDRNAEDVGAGDDWDTPPKPTGSAVVFTGILQDISTTNGDQFQGGGSKDNNTLDQWLWKAGEPLDKDDITDAYAAGYVNTQDTANSDPGDFIVYYGLDRLANNGTAQVGFWFFKDDIGLTNQKSGGGFRFSGQHEVGDILVQSNFTQGGVISTITVYKWVGSGGSNGALDQILSGTDCVGGPSDDEACATVNQATTNAPWPYASKTPDPASPDDFPTGTFFEGGINISQLVPGGGCFSSFMAETRSSAPFDARLKDLRLGSFNTCSASVDTDATPTGGSVTPGTSATDTATVTGTSLVGGTPPTPEGTVDFFLCQPSEVTAAGCPTGAGTKIGDTKTLNSSGQATSDATTNTTAIGKYCWRAEYTPAADSPYTAKSFTNATDECFTTVAAPTTTTTRQFVYPQDKAKITASAGGNLAGNVYFRLFDTLANCQGDDETPAATGLKFASGAIAVSGAAPQVKTTNNTTYTIDSAANTTHYWHVIYDSTNTAQLDSESDCAESTAVTFGGDDTSIAIP